MESNEVLKLKQKPVSKKISQKQTESAWSQSDG